MLAETGLFTTHSDSNFDAVFKLYMYHGKRKN